MIDGNFEVKPLHLIGEDERGSTYNYSIRENGDYILITRKMGSLSGNTFHKGVNLSTNPKTLILINGSIEFSCRHIDSKVHEVVIVDEPSVIMIKPFVTHSVKALTDIIILECNSISDIKDDRYFQEVIITESEEI